MNFCASVARNEAKLDETIARSTDGMQQVHTQVESLIVIGMDKKVGDSPPNIFPTFVCKASSSEPLHRDLWKKGCSMPLESKKLQQFGPKDMLHNALLLGGASLKGNAWRDPASDGHYYFKTLDDLFLMGLLDMDMLSGVIMFEALEYPGGVQMPGQKPKKILEYVIVEEHREDGWFYLTVTEQPR